MMCQRSVLSGWKLAGLSGLVLSLLLGGCSSQQTQPTSSSRYSISQDRAPSDDRDVSDLENAMPRYEEPRTAGNKSPYTVWGRSYRVMSSADGYVDSGIASWYGEKFHGHRTSNGEVFDMYAMSAAHRSLPIPSYARVTNLDNGRSVIVRVNDRGPFHDDRLIDLSYAAAKKLGYHLKGTARVEVAAITVQPDGRMTLAGSPFDPSQLDRTVTSVPPATTPSTARNAGNLDKVSVVGDLDAAARATDAAGTGRSESGAPQGLFVQVGSFSRRGPAEALVQVLPDNARTQARVKPIKTSSGVFHRVQVGPFPEADSAERVRQNLLSAGYEGVIVLTDDIDPAVSNGS